MIRAGILCLWLIELSLKWACPWPAMESTLDMAAFVLILKVWGFWERERK